MKNLNEYTLFKSGKKSFEEIYSTEDPWNLKGRQEQFRYKIVINYIKKNFQKPVLKVLELGCSEGHFTEYLGREEFKVTGVDISDTAVERAKKKNIPETEFVCSEMIEYVAGNEINKFDLILMMECIYYLSKDKKMELLELLHRKMKPEAKLLVSAPLRKDNEMFLSKDRILKKFGHKGFGLYRDYKGIVLSLKGINGKLLEFIPTYHLKKLFLFLHKIIFPFRINQRLFLFRRD